MSSSCAQGGVCPPGLRCVTTNGADVCALSTCGDGRLDPGESCDDGNNALGDGCAANCVSTCGDGRLDLGEACDDHNTIGGDGCSADCRSTEVCGNHVVDPGEACDDGNLDSHDGCTAQCTVEAAEWTALELAPPPRMGHAVAYDAAHGALVLFGGRGPLGLVGDTWTWNGAIWRRLDPAIAPPPRKDHAMTYDAARGRVVLFGGGGPEEHSTWEWDGVRWIERLPAIAPPSRLAGAAMAYDAARHKVVLFGGRLDDADQAATWEWDGEQWQQIATAASPPPRAGHAMTYDAVRGTLVVFGGQHDGQPLGDTWEFDGVDWTARASATAPEPRAHAAMAFDVVVGRIALFGGDGDAGLLGDTWTWDGTQWAAGPAGPAPRARSAAAMAYDAQHGHLVLFGGEQQLDPAVVAAGLSSETWIWDGGWDQRTVRATLPEPRNYGGMAYDPVRGTVVLFGGQRTGIVPNRPDGVYRDFGLNDTWEWDGASWIALAPTVAPSPRFGMTMAWDGQHIVMFGGLENVNEISRPRNDTWELIDAQWVQRTTLIAPPPRYDAGTAYDPLRGKLLLFGGYAPPDEMNDTWEWDGTGWAQRFPAHVPSRRFFPAMAFDPVQGRVLMFGGSAVTGGVLEKFDDTWEWTGDDWVQLATTGAPSAGSGHAIAHDASRGRIVVFDGKQPTVDVNDAKTWEWDGTSWVERAPATTPLQQDGLVMAYDVRRDRMVMFGGTASASGGTVVSEWDGTDWRNVAPFTGLPAARSLPAMVYDAERAEVVMFGGGTGASLNYRPKTALSETWIWNGATWRAQQPVVSPPASFGHAMAYDSLRHITVMLGPVDATTWEWDGTTWTAPPTGKSPGARYGATLVYHAARKQTLLLGGSTGATTYAPVSEFWAWDGVQWTMLERTLPFASIHAAAAYDAARDRVVVFGGLRFGKQSRELWEWDGQTWSDRTPAAGVGPSAREGHTLVYNAARQRSVVFGGRDANNFVLNDVWEWDGTVWSQLTPSSPPTPRWYHTMVYDQARRDLVVFGGNDSFKELHDMWLLRFGDPGVPDEARAR